MGQQLGGWTRLWIVVSVIYGVLVVAVALSTVPQDAPYQADHLKGLSTESLELLSAGHKRLAQLRVEYPQYRDTDDWLLAKQINDKLKGTDFPYTVTTLEMANGARFWVPDGTPPEKTDRIAQEYSQVVKTDLYAKRWLHAGYMLAVWAGPVLTLLLAGLSVRWIWAGFQQGARRRVREIGDERPE